MNDLRSMKELFARLFVLAFWNKMNLLSFTAALSKSELIKKLELKEYDDYFNKELTDIFFDITGNRINEDNSYGVYNDAYWCGYSYFELQLRTQKPFTYIFLKLPLTKMVDIYTIYHEMDFSSLLEYFVRIRKEKTILRLLCEQRRTSLTKASYETGIGLATLAKYNADDGALYKASFQNVFRIAEFFGFPISLFVQRISQRKLDKGFIEIYGDNYMDYFSNTRVACRGIVINDGNILLVYAKNSDVWMIPGGGAENEEEETSCVKREISEETGYVVDPTKCVLEIDEYYENEKYISKYFLCNIVGQSKAQLTEQEAKAGLESKWIPIKDAIDIFRKHQQYAAEDEMKRGIYLREYLALRRIIQGK